jgi:Acyclic terpene utilisation family protein AtuA
VPEHIVKPGVARVVVPVGMLGLGFPSESVARGIALGADAIAVDAGSTDSGPYYLATGTAKTTEEAVTRDLRILVVAGKAAGIPVIVGSCGTSGTDDGVDWVAAQVERIAREERLRLRVARLYSEQDPDRLRAKLRDGRILPLEPAGPLDERTLLRCERIVGLMGHEPIADAVDAGAEVVLAGRATDTAVLGAVPLLLGCPPGPTWHAAKTAECGGLCTTNPLAAGVHVEIDATGFTIESLDPAVTCTPTSVAAHMLYENADPFRVREPAGTLDTSAATYTALDDRRVRVEGSWFEAAEPHTMKLEGAAVAGYRTISLAGIRDPEVLARIDTWTATLQGFLVDGIDRVLGLGPDTYRLELRCYGWNAVLGDLDPDHGPAREVGVLLVVTAPEQVTANKIAKYANPYLLHLPLPGVEHLPSYAFMSSPAEIPCGAVHEFLLQHAVELEAPGELVRTELADL